MQTDKNRRTKVYLIILLLCLFSSTVDGKNELKQLSDYLDYLITHKEQYDEKKEQDINNLRKLLVKKESSPEYIYEINLKLYLEYKKYKLDSALHYAFENVRIAEKLGNTRLKTIADINLASISSYSGKAIESAEILKSLTAHHIPKDIRSDYYEAWSRFYEHYSAISNQSKYHDYVEVYRDSLLSVVDPSTFRYKINLAHKYIASGKNEEAEEILNNLLETEAIDTPEHALITHYLSSIYGMKGQPELELKYCIMSAIADVKNSIKENVSFQRLATIYYNNDDIGKAFRYSQSAVEDAVSSGVQFRATQMSEFYSIVNASYQMKEAKTNSKLRRFLSIISILSVFLILLVLYVYKQMKKLSLIKEELSQINGKLKELIDELNTTNSRLNETNEQLSEANQIKEQYIAHFFNLCATYIDKMEDFRKILYKLAVNRNYEEVVKRLRSTTLVDNELEDLYKHFDSIFLSLYPTFVSDFNALLDKEEQIQTKAEDLLNRELRIYALLRLGITDSAKIAGFLHCSMSTIYNYRTKMRNKAAFNRLEFEEMVMKIGNGNEVKDS